MILFGDDGWYVWGVWNVLYGDDDLIVDFVVGIFCCVLDVIVDDECVYEGVIWCDGDLIGGEFDVVDVGFGYG